MNIQMREQSAVADSPVRELKEVSLTVVVPVYNEIECLGEFHRRLMAVLDTLECTCAVLYVDDGSTDGSGALLQSLQADEKQVGILALSRNFGKELALTAGLDHADSDLVAIIDADLQDPPELLQSFLDQWREGYDVIYGTRIGRRGESLTKRWTAAAFYRVMKGVSQTPVPPDTGDFRLLSRRAVDALRSMPERHRFMKGLFTWVGFRQTSVPYERDARFAGTSKWNYWRLWNFALEGITSFTAVPLRLATYFGFVVSLLAFIYGVFIIAKTLLFGEPVQGYPSLMVVILFMGGVQLIAVGIIGEYVGRIYDESKQRPLYLVEEYRPAAIVRVSR